MEYIQYEITEQNLEAYKHSMMENEKSPATIEKIFKGCSFLLPVESGGVY